MPIEAGNFRRGQALVELAFGMFALALVLAAFFGFGEYILRSLKIQRTLRAEAGVSALTAVGDGAYETRQKSDTVEVQPFAAEHVFGTARVKVREEVHVPAMSGLDL